MNVPRQELYACEFENVKLYIAFVNHAIILDCFRICSSITIYGPYTIYLFFSVSIFLYDSWLRMTSAAFSPTMYVESNVKVPGILG